MEEVDDDAQVRSRVSKSDAQKGARKRTDVDAASASAFLSYGCGPSKSIFELDHRPVHVAQDSLLSSSSGYTNYRGFFNLCMLLLFLSNVRVALENVLKYGILVNSGELVDVLLQGANRWPVVLSLLVSHVFIVVAFVIEKLLALRVLTNGLGALLTAVNCVSVLVLPATVILVTEPNPFSSVLCLLWYTTLFLKFISYAHVNYWLRLQTFAAAASASTPAKSTTVSASTPERRPSSTTHTTTARRRATVTYPDSVTLGNMYYFVAVPTLCYELSYPRSPKVRKYFLCKRLLEVLFLPLIILALGQQWIVPLLKNSVEPFVTMNFSHIVERVLKLAIPNHVLWLIFFYLLFHSFYNCTAECLRFADREFYRDWWNADTIQYFWQNWNIPVHRWSLRHVYKPMLRAGVPRVHANVVVFLVSAFFHEYIISVPLHMFRVWAFCAMLCQIPLNAITARIPRNYRVVGNTIVWLSLIVGQPLCILMYVHDWYVLHVVRHAAATVTAA